MDEGWCRWAAGVMAAAEAVACLPPVGADPSMEAVAVNEEVLSGVAFLRVRSS